MPPRSQAAKFYPSLPRHGRCYIDLRVPQGAVELKTSVGLGDIGRGGLQVDNGGPRCIVSQGKYHYVGPVISAHSQSDLQRVIGL